MDGRRWSRAGGHGEDRGIGHRRPPGRCPSTERHLTHEPPRSQRDPRALPRAPCRPPPRLPAVHARASPRRPAPPLVAAALRSRLVTALAAPGAGRRGARDARRAAARLPDLPPPGVAGRVPAPLLGPPEPPLGRRPDAARPRLTARADRARERRDPDQTAASRIACASSRMRAEVVLAAERLRVQLGHVLRPRRAGGEPALRRHDLEPADRRVVAGRPGQLRDDRVAAQRRRGDGLRREPPQRGLELGRRRRVDPPVRRRARTAPSAPRRPRPGCAAASRSAPPRAGTR